MVTFSQSTRRDIGAAVFGVVAALILGVGILTYQTKPNVVDDGSLSEVISRSDSGTHITFNGQVDAILNAQAFTLTSPGLGGERVLVISRESLVPVGGRSGLDEPAIRLNEQVIIDGRIQQFSLWQIEDELKTDLVDSEFMRWEGSPVIIADNIKEST